MQNEFTVSNYTLTAYNGVGGVVTIPSDMNIWYIAEEAFKDNDNITKLIIPSTVIDIRERAFINCTALEEVYFVNENHRVDENGNLLYYDNDWNVTNENGRIIDWADLSMIYEQAFYGCTKLKKVDFSNVKTATIARECFAGCTALNAIDGGYEVLEGTLRIEAYAFYDLNKDVLDKIVLPYTLNTIGDGAFLESGIETYVFESIQAPVLETVYRAEIESAIESVSTTSYYKGYYYANFETYVYNLSSYVGEKSTIKMEYPSNGVGYDNHIYTLYFGERTATGVLPADETRDCIDLIENQFPTEATLNAWKTADANDTAIKAEIEAVSELVKRARVYFNNACTNDQQAQFVLGLEEKLLDVEEALRAIKARFGIKVTLSEVRIAEGSTHKDQYKVGEVFDMTGLVVELVYDDYSTEIADFSQLKLVTTEALTKYDKVVEIKYKSKTLRIRVTVTEESEETPPQQSGDSSAEEEKGCGSVVGISGLLAAVALGAAVLLKKKEN